MSDATMTSKGQTTIPRDIREGLDLAAGDRLTFTLMPDGAVIMRAKKRSIVDLYGIAKNQGRKPLPLKALKR